MTTKPRATLAHVAKAANVSITTASEALRGTGRVNPETRDHVQSVARALGYRKNSGASSLREGGGQLVGLVLESDAFADDPLNPKLFWPRFLNGFASELNAAGIGIVLVTSENLDPLSRAPIDALVVLAELVGELADSLPFGMPVVAGATNSANVVATASHDYPTIARQCIDHLKSEGATQIAFAVPASRIPTMDSIYELLVTQAHAQGVATTTTDSSAAAIASALADGADAVVTVGENVGGIINAISTSGSTIPDDVVLLSLSEGDFTQAFDPPVTTMWFKGFESGRVVADVVRRGLADGNFESVELPHELQLRASTARRTGGH